MFGNYLDNDLRILYTTKQWNNKEESSCWKGLNIQESSGPSYYSGHCEKKYSQGDC